MLAKINEVFFKDALPNFASGKNALVKRALSSFADSKSAPSKFTSTKLAPVSCAFTNVLLAKFDPKKLVPRPGSKKVLFSGSLATAPLKFASVADIFAIFIIIVPRVAPLKLAFSKEDPVSSHSRIS